MMTYLSEDDHPGDWTMPEGLYRGGEFVFKKGARPAWTTPAPQQSPTPESPTTESPTTESSSSTSETSSTQSSTTTPNSGASENNTQQPNPRTNVQNQTPQVQPRRQ
jgi:penicillin-binding protein 1A